MQKVLIRILSSVLLVMVILPSIAKDPEREFYSLIIYCIKNKAQEEAVERYLKLGYLPSMHKAGKNKIGVFKPIASDTIAFGKSIYVLTPYTSLEEFNKITNDLSNGQKLLKDNGMYLDAAHDEPPYERMETILMNAFTNMPQMETPSLKGLRSERVYELRSYESATEKLYRSKVKMFNQGDEIGLFKRLQFNAVFYAEVLAGGRMPNLIYMTAFENRASREEHWKAFREDPQWKALLTIEEYKHTVSKSDIMLLAPTDYSDY